METGTYLGDTTSMLAKISNQVYSIEPEKNLYANAIKRFAKIGNVKIINGTSEVVFPGLLPKISGDVNFWLDGHFSGGITFQGKLDTPILEELRQISENLPHYSNVAVMVDDVRCFNPTVPEYANYPSIDSLVDWAHLNGFEWHIEHDIFVAIKTTPTST